MKTLDLRTILGAILIFCVIAGGHARHSVMLTHQT